MTQLVRPPSNSPRKTSRVRPPKYAYRIQEEFSVTEIVQAIANGLPTNQVDPKLFQFIYNPLKTKRINLLQENNLYAVRAIDDAINEINEYYYKLNKKMEKAQKRNRQGENINSNYNSNNRGSSPTTAAASNNNYRQQNDSCNFNEEEEDENENGENKKFSSQEITAGVHFAIEGQYDQIDTRMYDQLLNELRRQKAKSIEKSNFQKAAIFDQCARRIIMLDDENKYNTITSNKVQEYDQKVQSLRTDLSDLRTDWNARLAEAKRQRDEDIKQIKLKAESQLEIFDQQFEKKPPLNYHKFSQTYLNLRVQEKFLMKSKRYDEAMALKEHADQLQVEEEQQFRKKYEADLETKRNDFIRKIQETISAREETANRQFLKIQRDSKREIEHAKKALEHYEAQANEMEQLASIANPTAPTQTTNQQSPQIQQRPNAPRPPQSARAGPPPPPCSVRSVTKSRRSVRTVRDLKTPHDLTDERDAADVFRQRRAINNVMYTKRTLPNIRKSVA